MFGYMMLDVVATRHLVQRPDTRAPQLPRYHPVVPPPRHQRRGREKKACAGLFLNFIAFAVAGMNILWAYSDVNRKHLVLNGGMGRANGYEAIIISNLVLMVGVLFGRQVLVAIWICVYAFILVLCSIKSVVESHFPWTPGVSYSSTIWIVAHFKLHEAVRPLVAIVVTLSCFLLVFLVFMVKGILKVQKTQARHVQGEAPTGTTTAAVTGERGVASGSRHRLGGLWELLRQSSRSSSCGSSENGSLPAYSDLESSTVPPPQYEDAIKGENGGAKKTSPSEVDQSSSTSESNGDQKDAAGQEGSRLGEALDAATSTIAAADLETSTAVTSAKVMKETAKKTKRIKLIKHPRAAAVKTGSKVEDV